MGVVWVALTACAVVGWRYWQRSGVAADVTAFTPADADAVLWIPRVDRFTEGMLHFSRGIQEAARFRELLKPETGVDIGDSAGLRKVGIDPEAGLVVFSRQRLVHILFGVEDAEAFTEVLKAKFVNLGHPPVRHRAPDKNDVVIYEVPPKAGHGDALYAAFAAHDGLMVLVYRGGGKDPVGGVSAVLAGQNGAGFFQSPTFAALQERLSGEGPLLYVRGATLGGANGLSFLEGWGLPPIASAAIRARVGDWLERVEYVAARLAVTPCAAEIHGLAHTPGRDVSLLPESWRMPDGRPGPDFGALLPRDTVVMSRVALDVSEPVALVRQLGALSNGLSGLGGALGLETPKDPFSGILAELVHPSLADRHVLTDVAEHLTGQAAVALVGISRQAKADDILAVSGLRRWLGETMQTALLVQVKDPAAFWTRWWSKSGVLGQLGFEVERLAHPEWQVLRLTRGCAAPGVKIRRRKGVRPPPCEKYGVILAGDVLVVTTGDGTLERLYEVAAGQSGQLVGLTREPLAKGVLQHAPMVVGTYFSFDGLLNAIRNLNLPGGATRYLAQMFELAITLDTADGDVMARVLLTR